MAGQPPAPLQSGEGSSRSDSSFLERFLRRPLHTNDQENASALSVTASGSIHSPANSIAALISNYDDLSGANPWQNVSASGPSSPISQREYYNQHSPLSPSCHVQRDLTAEYPWIPEVLDLQRAANPDSQVADSAGSDAHDDMDWQRFSRGNSGHYNDTEHAGNAIRRRLEQAINPAGSEEQAEAFWYEEAAAATAWHRNGGLNENLAWWESSRDSASAAVPQLDVTRNELTRMRRERMGMSSPSGRHREAGEVDACSLPRLSRGPPPVTTNAGRLIGSTKSAKSPSTSLSSETGGGDSDDEGGECTKSIEPRGSVGGDGDGSAGKRKTAEESGEDGDSAKVSVAELKRSPSSRLRKRSTNATMKLREPRYAIKTRTDVDIMDDGFKWRKYGVKAVKNSPHPRNYYKCTTPHCPVRKRVERSHEDSGLVITTYEGKHSHLTPGFPCSDSHTIAVFSGERPLPPPGVLFPNPALGLSRSLLPLPPEFAHLAALYQMRVLRSLAQQHQANVLSSGRVNLLPASWQWDNLLRAQHWLRLQDAAFGAAATAAGVGTSPSSSAYGSAKQEPFPFTNPDFMTNSRSSHGLQRYPAAGRPFPFAGLPFLDRMEQFMRAAAAQSASPSASPRHLRPPQSNNLDSFPDDFPPSADNDLVRRDLEAEEQDHFLRGS